MFTGIIQAVGKIASLQQHGEDVRLGLDVNNLDISSRQKGDSIAVNGVCLTVVDWISRGFAADVSIETMNCTTFGELSVGDPVNLESALTLNQPLGGHLVSGHIDGVGEVLSRRVSARSVEFVVKSPSELARYIAHKGSITVDGVSLTVNSVEENKFFLNIIPHTLQETNLDLWCAGFKVNLEVDVIARYLERLVFAQKSADRTDDQAMMQLLTQRGFVATDETK